MIKRLLKRRVHVMPVAPGSEIFGWQVVEQNAIQAFFGDLRAAGLWIAKMKTMRRNSANIMCQDN